MKSSIISPFSVLLTLLTLVFISCDTSQSISPRWILVENNFFESGSNAFPTTVYPNDAIHGDSALVQFRRGVFLEVRPSGSYSLTIEYSGSDVPELNLFDIEADNYNPTIIQGTASGSSIIYEWEEASSSSISPQYYIASLTSGNSLLKSNISSLEYSAVGQTARPLGINVHFIGVDERYETPEAKSTLAEAIFNTMSTIYGDVPMGDFTVISGVDHPKYGSQITGSDNVSFDLDWNVNLGNRGSINLDSLSGGLPSSQIGNLDVVIVPFIEGDGFVGLAPFFGRSLNSGLASVAVVGASTQIFGFSGSELVENSDSLIANTMAHEIGHFLGLRHTTATANDILSGDDRSIQDDGLASTPFNEACFSTFNRLKGDSHPGCQTIWMRHGHHNIQYRITKLTQAALSDCPDAGNLMFPTVVPGVEQVEFESEQGDIIDKTLSLLNF